MAHHIIWYLRLLSFLILAGSASDCSGWFAIDQPGDTDNDFQNCATANGIISFSRSDTGPMDLTHVVHVNGSIQTQRGRSPIEQVPSIAAPALVSASVVYFDTIYPVGRISFPRLEDVTARRSFLDCADDADADFPQLVHAGSAAFHGSFASMNLDSLQTIDGDFTTGSPYSGVGHALSLPSLESVGFMRLSSNHTRFSMPNLVSAGPPSHAEGSTSTESGLRFHMDMRVTPYQLNLPKLSSVDSQLYVHGPFERLELSVCQETNALIHIDSTRRLSFSLPLRAAAKIELAGAIESAAFPNLTSYTSIWVNSTRDFDCDSFMEQINTTAPYPDPIPIVCYSRRSYSGLPLAAKVAVAVVIPSAVIFLLGLAFWLRRRQRGTKNVNSATTIPASRRAPATTDARTGPQRPAPPPEYSLRRCLRSSGPGASPGTGVEMDALAAPPPYSRDSSGTGRWGYEYVDHSF
ncbi:hypothetical protein BJY04DRAFT_217216 [Aspergillus karnatakaensis]|uniref:uncharacterized protein n=1 Tax=Aspergillus karnatakaensis TaxID=1810916 RepID=UPI003CCE3243